MKYTVEAIAFNIESCSIIQNCGAQRIELCDGPGEGGTTPSHGMIKAARAAVDIQLYPIIRPRGGDFLYSNAEYAMMQTDILLCKQLGCDGVVIGILNSDGTIDKDRCSKLVEMAYPMGVTFHRAFDRATDAASALETIIETGCERILTSGLHPTATEGSRVLQQLIQQADGRIIIMPGSGVRSANIAELAAKTGAVEFHTSARTLQKSAMQYSNPAMKEDLQTVTIDAAELAATVAALTGL